MTELKDSLPEVHQSSRGSSPLVTGSISDMITPSKFASQSDCMKIDTDSSCQDSGYEKTSDTVSDCEDQIQVTTYEISSSAPPMDSPLDECDISGAVTAEVDGEDDGDDIEGDNMSMVVNQGDGGSRRASDLSTLSGLVLEDYMGGSTSQPESSDGFESPDKERRDFADEGTLKKHRDDGPDGETYDNVGDSCDAGVDSAVEDRNDADGEQLDYQYVNPVISKRNSAEIRNNIPDVNEVKDYIEDDDDLEPLKSNKHGAIPKMKKQSPGLARRVASDNSPPRDSSSSERDTTDEPLKKGKNVDLELHGKNRTKERSVSKSPVLPRSNDNHHNTVEPTDGEVNQSNGEHSTEYNIHAPQHNASNRYVGARLAFTSESIDSPSHNPESEQCNGGWASPEKAGAFQQITLEEFEKSLTEIPLDDTLDENKVNTLSEQASDVEENDGESVISETAVGNGMPNVMDGLSDSREGSDIEEFLASPEGREIQRKLDEETEQQRHLEEMKRQEVRSAMADIKSAIQKGKSAQLKSSVGAQDAPPGEAVWVMRDSYVERLQQQDEMKRVRQEIERSQEEECRRREMDQVYQIEMEDESQLTQQSKRHGGNIYKTPKGYDSDSDSYEEEHDKPMAGSWFRRKYAPIQTEGDDQQYVRQKMRSNGNRPRSHYIPNNDHSKIPAMNEKSQSSKYSSKSAENLSSGAHSYDTSVRSGYCTSPVQRDDYQPQSDPIHSSRLATANDQNRNSYHDSSSDYDSQKEEDLTPTAYVQQRKEGDYDTDEETDQLLDKQYKQEEKLDIPELQESPVNRASQNRRTKAKEVAIYDPDEPSVLIEGVLFRARYLGSTQLVSEGQPSKALRMMQAQEAVGRIKAPEGESQPSTEVDLFVSTEKIMVLNTDLQEIMMDHALRTISYIADIEDIVVIMARRRTTTTTTESGSQKRQTKIICHVFETEEAQLVAQSIGQAFQVAYMEFLKANGIEDPGLLKDVNYEDVLNQQEIFGEELNLFANKEAEKEVIVPKIKGEALGIVIVESGWGSMVPTVVLANMSPTGAAARCGQLNIGDQIMAVNGVSLVGLPLSSCQTQIKSVKGQSVVKLTVVSCAPVVEVLIKRPDTKYQLGFSVQNGVICSLLRGGIAERGGVRVGHRIIEINSSSVVAVPHEKIVSMLANSVGEIHMKTMPTAIYRLLTGQEAPHYI